MVSLIRISSLILCLGGGIDAFRIKINNQECKLDLVQVVSFSKFLTDLYGNKLIHSENFAAFPTRRSLPDPRGDLSARSLRSQVLSTEAVWTINECWQESCPQARQDAAPTLRLSSRRVRARRRLRLQHRCRSHQDDPPAGTGRSVSAQRGDVLERLDRLVAHTVSVRQVGQKYLDDQLLSQHGTGLARVVRTGDRFAGAADQLDLSHDDAHAVLGENDGRPDHREHAEQHAEQRQGEKDIFVQRARRERGAHSEGAQNHNGAAAGGFHLGRRRGEVQQFAKRVVREGRNKKSFIRIVRGYRHE
ncbi:unnamed protein product [Trichogramma brassicae]|uniref:Uncharacterized protein n=1 Tax=Trichogramma brassicae TaxID=86971 RepID=A0A6H5J3L4_9HYME|nr:unnamed protein product [Trichogramma brassicae]